MWNHGNAHRVSQGESVVLKARLKNRLTTALTLSNLRLDVQPLPLHTKGTTTASTTTTATTTIIPTNDTHFHRPLPPVTTSFDLTIPPGSHSDVILRSTPSFQGAYRVAHIRWSLGEALSVCQPLNRPGPLLQKALKHRSMRSRGDDATLCFDVLPPQPSLHIRLEGGDLAEAIQWDLKSMGGSKEPQFHHAGKQGVGSSSMGGPVLHLLQGQILFTNLIVRNEGENALL